MRGFILLFILIFSLNSLVYADVDPDVKDILIWQDIGSYKLITQTVNPLTKKIVQIPEHTIKRISPGKLVWVGHFDLDHDDITYQAEYENTVAHLGVLVQVTKHTGSKSDKWLLHEVDMDFRNYFGLPNMSFVARLINGQTIIEDRIGGGCYRWISGNLVIDIEYYDLQLEKPEPIEIVQAYLAKFPSTLPVFTSADLRTNSNKASWVKDEMERRLWLADKWLTWQKAGNSGIPKTVREVNKNLGVFLNYRDKYYGINPDSDKAALNQFEAAPSLQSIKVKLAEYKIWWVKNKNKRII